MRKPERARGNDKRRNLKLLLEYEGTGTAGWQWQKDRPTIQGQLVRAIEKVLGERVILYAAGRTDAGVHARGQVANFRTAHPMPCERLRAALNAHLPEDITVLGVSETDAAFHAQFSARRKLYRYAVWTGPVRSSIDRKFCYWRCEPLSIERMRRAARHLVGRHDFRAFGTEVPKEKATRRTVYRLGVSRRGRFVYFDIEGDGFLYNMVRAIVGTLLWVGRGKLEPEAVREILRSRDRRKAGPNAPARGLCLERVWY